MLGFVEEQCQPQLWIITQNDPYLLAGLTEDHILLTATSSRHGFPFHLVHPPKAPSEYLELQVAVPGQSGHRSMPQLHEDSKTLLAEDCPSAT